MMKDLLLLLEAELPVTPHQMPTSDFCTLLSSAASDCSYVRDVEV